jgi:UDP-N-acetylmuramoylalanine--D-glutamate ligase
MNEAIDLAYNLAKTGDKIVLSPACASYDQFDNYEQRGRLFKEYVNSLKD